MGKHVARKPASRAKLVSRSVKATLGSLSVGAITAGLVTVAGPGAQASATVWDAVAQCESNGRWNINTGNGYYGGLQFSASTWRAFGGTKYAPFAHQATREQQIEIAQNVLRGQGPRAWPTCGRRAGLTVANGSVPLEITPVVVTADTVVPQVRKLSYNSQILPKAGAASVTGLSIESPVVTPAQGSSDSAAAEVVTQAPATQQAAPATQQPQAQVIQDTQVAEDAQAVQQVVVPSEERAVQQVQRVEPAEEARAVQPSQPAEQLVPVQETQERNDAGQLRSDLELKQVNN